MRYTLFIVLLAISSVIMADERRLAFTFSSSNGNYEFKYLSGETQQPGGSSRQKWALLDTATGRTRYPVTGEFASKTVLVSNDGASLVAIDDSSEGEPAQGLIDVISFYREGKLIGRYSLDKLLNDTCNISRSVSHFSWFFRSRDLAIVNSRVTLTTYELVTYEFDVRTGGVVKKATDPILTADSLYAYGKVQRQAAQRYALEVYSPIYGSVTSGDKVIFDADGEKFLLRDKGYYAVVIREGRLTAVKNIMLNACTYKRGS